MPRPRIEVTHKRNRENSRIIMSFCDRGVRLIQELRDAIEQVRLWSCRKDQKARKLLDVVKPHVLDQAKQEYRRIAVCRSGGYGVVCRWKHAYEPIHPHHEEQLRDIVGRGLTSFLLSGGRLRCGTR